MGFAVGRTIYLGAFILVLFMFVLRLERHHYQEIFTFDITFKSTHDTNNAALEEKYRRNAAVGLVAFGKATQTNMVQRCIRSIRTRGRWTGYIFIITDGDFNDIVQEDSNVILVRPQKQDDPSLRNVAGDRLIMSFKRFKTLVIDYLDRDERLVNIEYVLYMDIDIVVGASLSEFLDSQVSQYDGSKRQDSSNEEESHMLMFPDNERHPKDIHSGVILLHREYSLGCLELWRKLMDEMPEVTRDQKLIKRIYYRKGKELKDGGGCEILKIPNDYLLFPEKSDLKTKQIRTFIHLTNTGRAKRLPPSMQKKYLEYILQLTRKERRNPMSLANKEQY